MYAWWWQNVQTMATPPAGAAVDRRVEIELKENIENKGAGGGCHPWLVGDLAPLLLRVYGSILRKAYLSSSADSEDDSEDAAKRKPRRSPAPDISRIPMATEIEEFNDVGERVANVGP